MLTWDQVQKLSDEQLLHEAAARPKYDTSEYSIMLARELRFRRRHGRCGGLPGRQVGPSLRLLQTRRG